MQTTTLSYENLHLHGDLFPNVLRSRERALISRRKWALPQVDGMEFDQYDTPASRWIAVHQDGKVLASMRMTPTTARCGVYSYMIRDAQLGLLPTIPPDLLYDEAPVSAHIWEGSRVQISAAVPARKRLRVQQALKDEIVHTARGLGVTGLLAMLPENGVRLIRRVDMPCRQAGPVIEIENDRMVCVMLGLGSGMH